ncbi:MAG: PVC-type heme-binding CxxCH protein [Pirellulales bacterium]
MHAWLRGVAIAAPPQVLDPRLKIELVADSDQIVTPTGIACDRHGRLLVVECHTHMRPDDYDGPPADRIRRFEDTNGDGRADRITTFHEGSVATMGIAIAPDDSLLVATRSVIFRLHDIDQDGVAETRTELARLETEETYPHNGLSGFAQDFAGTIYFGLGENLSVDYRLVARDGTVIRGGGEGGNIFRIRDDGTGMQRVATGFWNPFGLACDTFGRLFCVDNDPDWRPPCRLLHIAAGGDYGYRRRYGRKGIHPFCAWFGELPGTLGMVAGTGEAPCGILPYDSDGLPSDYRGDLLTTSWGDHAIQRFPLHRRGASFDSVAQTVVQGDENFRPVGITLAPDGSVVLSDWVDRSYPLHGKGRIWRISRQGEHPRSARPDDPRRAVRSPHRPLRERAARALAAGAAEGRQELAELLRTSTDPYLRATAFSALVHSGPIDRKLADRAVADSADAVRALAVRHLPLEQFDVAKIARSDQAAEVRAAVLRRIRDPANKRVLLEALGDDDPFVRQAARDAMHRLFGAQELIDIPRPHMAQTRVELALLLRQTGAAAAQQRLPELLSDDDPRVRFVAIEWIGEERLEMFRGELMRTLNSDRLSGSLLSAVLAALNLLDEQTVDVNFEGRQAEIIGELLARNNVAASVQARALRLLPATHASLSIQRLDTLLSHADATVRLEAIRSLRESPREGRTERLIALAKDQSVPARLRAEAVVGLVPDDPSSRAALMDLALRGRGTVQRSALQSLRGAQLASQEIQSLALLAADRPELAELVGRLIDPAWKPSGRPGSRQVDAWLDWLTDKPSDPQAGSRIFFDPRGPGCSACHAYDGRGSDVGPDLAPARSLSRRRLVESVLQPSRDIAPQFVPWSLVTDDGQIFSGLLVGVDRKNREVYVDSQRRRLRVAPEEIEVRKQLSVSIMPDGLLDRLTDQEVRDLFALLNSGPHDR